MAYVKKNIEFSDHALVQMAERGVSRDEVVEAIEGGEHLSAKKDRKAFRKNFDFEKTWAGKFYHVKQVMPVVAEEKGKLVVVTVFSFYF